MGRRPWEERFLALLASCYFQCGYLAQAERLLVAIGDEEEPDTASTRLLRARIKLARGDLDGALQAVLAAEAVNPRLPGIYVQIGDTCARLHQWDNARGAYEKAVALDEDNARTHSASRMFTGLSAIISRPSIPRSAPSDCSIVCRRRTLISASPSPVPAKMSAPPSPSRPRSDSDP